MNIFSWSNRVVDIAAMLSCNTCFLNISLKFPNYNRLNIVIDNNCSLNFEENRYYDGLYDELKYQSVNVIKQEHY